MLCCCWSVNKYANISLRFGTGITSDANNLVDYCREEAQRYTYRFQEPIPVEHLVQILCDLKQSYTQFGGLAVWCT